MLKICAAWLLTCHGGNICVKFEWMFIIGTVTSRKGGAGGRREGKNGWTGNGEKGKKVEKKRWKREGGN